MADYQQLLDPMSGQISSTIKRRADNAFIPDDPANKDRQLFLEWCEAGNTPDPPDPLPDPPPPAPLTLAAHPEGQMDAVTKAYQDDAMAAMTARLDALERRLIATLPAREA